MRTALRISGSSSIKAPTGVVVSHHVGHFRRGYGTVGYQSQSGQYAALPAVGRRIPEGVMVYCHTTGHSIDDVLEDYARHKEMGFKAIRVQCGVPGMKTTYGMSKVRAGLRARH